MSPIQKSRLDHLVRVTPELIVRKRARVVESEEEEEDLQLGRSNTKQRKMDSLQQQMSRMLEGMDELKKNMATKEDIRSVNGRLRSIESEQKSFESRLTQLERDKANETRPTVGPRPRPLRLGGIESDVADFRKARRSVLLSPVDATQEAVKQFLLK